MRNKSKRPEIHHHHYNITASEGSNIIIGGTAHNVVSASENAVVVQGCYGGNISVNGSINCGQLTEQETEMLRLFRSFDMRRKTEAMACLFKIEDRIKEAALNG